MIIRKMACLLFVIVLSGTAFSGAFAIDKIKVPFRAVPNEMQYVPNGFIVLLTEEAGPSRLSYSRAPAIALFNGCFRPHGPGELEVRTTA